MTTMIQQKGLPKDEIVHRKGDSLVSRINPLIPPPSVRLFICYLKGITELGTAPHSKFVFMDPQGGLWGGGALPY